MSAEYIQYVRDTLGEDAARLSPQQRQDAYRRGHESLRQYYLQQGYSEEQYRAAAGAFTQAVAEVEREFAGATRNFPAPPPPPVASAGQHSSRLDRGMDRASDTLSVFKAGHAIFAFGLSLTSDFLKPVLELTVPVTFGAALGALALYVLSRRSISYRKEIVSVAYFCAALSVCSAGWWGLQTVIPGANAKGVVAEVVPGVSAAQNAMLSSLGRIEIQTKRVGDLLEENAKRDQARRDDAAQQQRKAQSDQIALARQRITEAGYPQTVDGYVTAIVANFRYLNDFETLGIKLTEDAVAKALGGFTNISQFGPFLIHVIKKRDDSAVLRKVHNAIAADGKKMTDAFTNRGAKAFVCDPKNYQVTIASAVLAAACQTDGLEFANRYRDYFNVTYGRPEDVSLDGLTFMINSPADLPRTKVPAIDVNRVMTDKCKYFEGEYTFFVDSDYVGSFLSPGSSESFRVLVTDPDFHNKGFNCASRDILAKRRPACRAQVIVASACTSTVYSIIKVLSVSSASAAPAAPALAPVQTAAALPTQAPTRGGSALSADDVRKQLVGWDVEHDGSMSFNFKKDGTFDAVDGRTSSDGRYRVENDGRVCWQNSRGVSGCFRYYRAGNGLRVKRDDTQSTSEIGPVVVSPLARAR